MVKSLRSIVVVLLAHVFAGHALAAAAAVPQQDLSQQRRLIDPSWEIGSTWMVRYTIERLSASMGGDARATVVSQFDYVYTVLPTVAHRAYPRVDIAHVRATTTDGLESWDLYFDRALDVLLRVEEVPQGPEARKTVHKNPFGSAPWLPNVAQYADVIIHDWPSLVSGSATVAAPAGSSTPAFEYRSTMLVQPNGALAMHGTLWRTDPASGLQQETTIVWKAGARWWNHATTTLGGTTLVTGQLLPQ